MKDFNMDGWKFTDVVKFFQDLPRPPILPGPKTLPEALEFAVKYGGMVRWNPDGHWSYDSIGDLRLAVAKEHSKEYKPVKFDEHSCPIVQIGVPPNTSVWDALTFYGRSEMQEIFRLRLAQEIAEEFTRKRLSEVTYEVSVELRWCSTCEDWHVTWACPGCPKQDNFVGMWPEDSERRLANSTVEQCSVCRKWTRLVREE